MTTRIRGVTDLGNGLTAVDIRFNYRQQSEGELLPKDLKEFRRYKWKDAPKNQNEWVVISKVGEIFLVEHEVSYEHKNVTYWKDLEHAETYAKNLMSNWHSVWIEENGKVKEYESD